MSAVLRAALAVVTFLPASLLAQDSSKAVTPADSARLVSAMKSDLRNLVVAEEAFFADSVKYSSKVGPGGVSYTPSAGNALQSITVTRDGWIAVMTNSNTTIRCTIFIGSTSLPPAVKEGYPTCK
ncbi:MAG TPA: hypothetical protein VKB45_12760 [Gemmatimonadales bacterium]|nr:hypothetical protein [Gemmatimonadales bacterium]